MIKKKKNDFFIFKIGRLIWDYSEIRVCILDCQPEMAMLTLNSFNPYWRKS